MLSKYLAHLWYLFKYKICTSPFCKYSLFMNVPIQNLLDFAWSPHLVNMFTVHTVWWSNQYIPLRSISSACLRSTLWYHGCCEILRDPAAATWQQLLLCTNYMHARTEILTPVLLRIHAFWDVILSMPTDPWRGRHYNPSKHQGSLTQQHSYTSQKTWILNYNAYAHSWHSVPTVVIPSRLKEMLHLTNTTSLLVHSSRHWHNTN
jgi:hypothetical protein